jgi:DNA repair exonuclease SbcCD ATPase subunit
MQGFMRYDDQTVELHPGFNAFVGQTDSGKTTVLRALVWVFYNRPSGVEMIRDGADEAVVTITFNTGSAEEPELHEVTRLRSKKRNAYILDGQEFDNVKLEVPQEIQDLSGIRIAEIGPKVYDMLNVSRQMDGPFMLTGSGGDAAKIMGNLAGITTLDLALSGLRPDLAAAKKEQIGYDKMEETYNASIGEFADLESEARQLEVVGKRIKLAQEISGRLAGLRRASERMAEYNATVATIDTDIATKAHITALSEPLNRSRRLVKRLSDLTQLNRTMDQYNSDVATLAAGAELAEARIVDLQHEYRALLHEAGTCPTCGAKQ